MKKTLFLAIFAICAAPSYAQWNIGAGMNFANYKANETGHENESTAGTGFYVKAGREIMLNNFIYIEPSFGFNSTKTNEDQGAGIKTSNIIVPIELGVKLSNYVKLNTGYQFNFLTKATSSYKDKEIDITDTYEDVYGNVIVGLSFSPGAKNIDITARYNIGTTKLFETEYSKLYYTKNAFSLGLKYIFI